MAMKAIILILLWGFVQGQSSPCELAHPDTWSACPAWRAVLKASVTILTRCALIKCIGKPYALWIIFVVSLSIKAFFPTSIP